MKKYFVSMVFALSALMLLMRLFRISRNME